MKKTAIIFSILMSLATVTQAQFSQFHVGLAFPSGKFADGEEIDDILARGKGGAATGFTAGFKYYSPLAAKNLSFVFGIEAFYNGLNSDVKDDVEDYSGFDDITFPMYFNFPVTVGLNYAVPLQESIKLYGEAAVGGNFSMPTTMKYADPVDNRQEMDFVFTSMFSFSYALEGGIFINDKYCIGLRYNNLGSYKYKFEVEYQDNSDRKEKLSKAIPITNLSLCVGVLF
jgi:hypothetical protein